MTGVTSPRLQPELLVGRTLAPPLGPTQAPMRCMVGMADGGTLREASVPSLSEVSSGRFGVHEAREALARKEQECTEVSASAVQAPASSAAPAPQGMPMWRSDSDWSAQESMAPEPNSAPAQAARREAPRHEATYKTTSVREATPTQAEPCPAAPP